ncbi:MAG: PKD domain-containing protein [candidate division Zixibacteria bacterium]|nr:PKD domain-containing protein [candidate division Zixibacteria bacterium]
MHYVSMICDKVSKAYDRMDLDYNFAGYPSCFFDGGDEVVVGGPSNADPMRAAVQACGARSVVPLDMIVATDWIANYRMKVRIKIGNGVPANVAPDDPVAPTGPTACPLNSAQNFQATIADSDNDSLLVDWDFGDGGTTGWTGPFAPGTVSRSHAYQLAGDYQVRVRINDRFGEISDWSPALNVTAACCLGSTGNINNDTGGAVDLSDLIYLVNFLFLGGTAPQCAAAANVNGDTSCNVDLSDLIYLVNFLFLGGSSPTACAPACE